MSKSFMALDIERIIDDFLWKRFQTGSTPVYLKSLRWIPLEVSRKPDESLHAGLFVRPRN